MCNVESNVISNYDRDGLMDTVLAALRRELGDLTRISPEMLAPIDEFHIRGRKSTVELAGLVGDLSGKRVLDVGCGLGGTSRYLASNYGCQVTGVDLTPTYVALAETLSKLVGLNANTAFREASALDLPFGQGEFDVVWMEHVQMNIENKSRLAEEVTRVLRSGGEFAFHEVFSASEDEIYFPVPWADTTESSFLARSDQFCVSLTQAGLEVLEWRDVTGPALETFQKAAKRLAKSGPPPLGLHLVMGESARAKSGNVGKNLSDGRVCVVEAVLRKP